TKTSSFGSPGRKNHDSSDFYNSRLYEGLPTEKKVKFIENPVLKENLDKVFCKSSEHMEELPDNSVHLMVTSPPYNVGKEYDNNLSLKEYREFLSRVWKDVYRVLVPGGRVCINVANLGRKPYIPLHAFIIEDMQNLGFLMRGEVIWNKASSASPSTAWGSWLSPKNPVLRDVHEYILVFSKDTYSRANHNNEKQTMVRDDFLELTKSIWTFNAESARKIGHPAPFPIELPLNCIKLYTFENDVILDPFIGSGSTAVAAINSNRHFVGYDIDPEYIKMADKRIKEARSEKSQIKITDVINEQESTQDTKLGDFVPKASNEHTTTE
ncbi:MAG: DNA-methyltransferase, partial [Candidatus Bathyarchaeales archaeon]